MRTVFTILAPTILSLASVMATPIAKAHEGEHHHEHTEGQVIVYDATVRAFLPASDSSVAYLKVANHGDKARKLVGAEVQTIGRVELHTHKHEDGVMKMRKVDSVDIAAGEQVVFQSGGLHLMLFEPSEKLAVGEMLKVTLKFADGDRAFTQAKVVNLLDEQESDGGHSHHHEE